MGLQRVIDLSYRIAFLDPELADCFLEKVTGCRFAEPESCRHEDCRLGRA